MFDPLRDPAPVPVHPGETPGDDPALGLFQVLREDGGAREARAPQLSAKTLLAMFRHMLRVRLLDERMMMRQRQGKVGFYGAITGQEATPIAAGFSLKTQDWVFPALRESAIMLVRGFPLTRYIAQVYGNAGDVLKGRQMPSHMSGRAVNQVAWSSCLGPQLPQAVGAAMAAKRRGDDAVVLGFIGDGATSEPDFHAAMNFAGVFRPPVVLICQNNHWAISVPSEKQTASATFAVKARAYGFPGVRVDGNDVLGTYRVIKEAVQRAREGGGPTFIEALTYRIGAHSSSDDPTRYRSEDEVEAWRQKDPLQRFERFLRGAGHLDDDLRARLEQELEAEIKAAITEVEAMPRPATETLFEDVYADVPWHLRAQEDELRAADPPPGHD
ncbi:MAG: thiamine pyrophosphate-dependent dehydrogenase E1 component subunit alpha [Myxococcota bacterium]